MENNINISEWEIFTKFGLGISAVSLSEKFL
jgi:hypothetical protein